MTNLLLELQLTMQYCQMAMDSRNGFYDESFNLVQLKQLGDLVLKAVKSRELKKIIVEVMNLE